MKESKELRRGIYPGSFDPLTKGHLDIIRRAAGLFDELYVGILYNNKKKSLFSVEERVKMIETVTGDIPGIRVITFSGLLADCCREYGIGTIVRGLRSAADFDAEQPVAQGIRLLDPKIDTVFLSASPEIAYISSSMVREMAAMDGDVSGLVPAELLPAVYGKYEAIRQKGTL